MYLDYGNAVRLRNNVYIVRTQAGFRKAIKCYCDEVPEHRRGYPKSYPFLVFFSLEYTGYHTLVATCIPLNRLESALVLERDRRLPENTKPKETNMENKIPGTTENWENRTLGASEQHVIPASPQASAEVDAALGLVTVKLRMPKQDVDKLEALAKSKDLILQAYIKSVLAKEISKT